MFGTYRTLLALMVVFLHLGGVSVLGGYAVFGFYILSGYLMTYIMQKNYGYSRSGQARYAINRMLRIYPIYWLACGVSLVLIAALGQQATSAFHPDIAKPDSMASLLRNLLLYFPGRESPRLTPPSWALTVEIFYYICIGLGLSKSRLFTLLWFAASVIYTLYANITGLGWDDRYFSIIAASLPFSTGALIFHYRNEFKRLAGPLATGAYAPLLLCVLIGLNWWLGLLLDTQKESSFYINYLLCALMVVILFDRRELPLISRNTDRIMGDFSYPVYLIHYQVGLVVLMLLNAFGFDFKRPDITLALIALPAIFAVAWLMTVAVERPIEMLRSKVKSA
jgi:peptidoglycan/LPS O-acetylase OafA/YrhL